MGTVSSPQSFLLTNGTFTYFSATGSTWTMATDINDAGQITGNELTAQGVWVGFLDSGGTFTTFAPAGATATVPYGINDSGQIVGYATVGGKSFSFVDTNGTFKTISVPGTLVLSTAASGINDQGDIVGTFTGPSGFLDTNGTFTTFAVPGAEATFVNGVNDAGDIVGYYYVVNGPDQGFLATPDASPIDVGPLPVMAGTIPGGMLVLGWLGRCLARRRQA